MSSLERIPTESATAHFQIVQIDVAGSWTGLLKRSVEGVDLCIPSTTGRANEESRYTRSLLKSMVGYNGLR